jgi:hypothetical protein
MRALTSIPRMYADAPPSAQFRRYVFENDRKRPRDPRESAEKKFPEIAR